MPHRRRRDRVRVEPGGQPQQQVESGRRAARPDLRQVRVERGEQAVAARPVDGADPAQVAGEGAGGDEPGEGELAQRLGGEVLKQPDADDVPRQLGRGDHPAEPQRGAEDLAHGAAVDDPLGIEALQRPDRRAVVAELGVVVVLDHQRAGRARPLEQPDPPVGRERGAGRVGVRGRQQHGPRVQPGQPRRLDAAAVNRDRDRLEPGRLMIRAVQREARVLHRDPGHAALRQRAAQQHQALREAAADHHLIRRGAHAPDPAQVRGERGPQFRLPARRRVQQGARRGRPAARRGSAAATRCGETAPGPAARCVPIHLAVAVERHRPVRLIARPGRLPVPPPQVPGPRPRVPEPCRDSRYPSMTSCSYAPTTRERDTPSSAASTRDGGSAVPGAASRRRWPGAVRARAAPAGCAAWSGRVDQQVGRKLAGREIGLCIR